MTASKKTRLSEKLDLQLDSYATQASSNTRRKEFFTYSAAATAAVAMGVNAEADIVYSGLVNTNFSITASFSITFGSSKFGFIVSAVPFDIDGDGKQDVEFNLQASIFKGGSISSRGAFLNLSAFNTATPNAGVSGSIGKFTTGFGLPLSAFVALNLTSGKTIGPAGSFQPAGPLRQERLSNTGLPVSSVVGFWNNSETRFLGVSFDRSGSTHYGWLQVHIDVDGTSLATFPVSSATVIDYAWEDIADTPIIAGQTSTVIPEPTSLSLLAMGAAGLLATRRMRRRREEEGEGEEG